MKKKRLKLNISHILLDMYNHGGALFSFIKQMHREGEKEMK